MLSKYDIDQFDGILLAANKRGYNVPTGDAAFTYIHAILSALLIKEVITPEELDQILDDAFVRARKHMYLLQSKCRPIAPAPVKKSLFQRLFNR